MAPWGGVEGKVLEERCIQPASFPTDQERTCVLSYQSCPALCNPMDCSPPGSSVHGILQEEYWSGLPFPFPRDRRLRI